VIHSPYGSRLNRAWGLALRKRFCTKFNFELQAAATEDNIVLSLTTAHSFDLAEVRHYLHPGSVRELLIQALLDAPMFMTRWRWVAGVALALPRFRGGKKVPPPLARMDAEDLITAIFPDQLACAENLAGGREIPDHPLIRQTIGDCLEEAMDIAGLEHLLGRMRSGEVRVVTRDLTEPSPLALEVLSARPYAYLDDAPLEERRTQAVMGRRWLAPEDAAEIGRLDPEAIESVRAEAWPRPRDADEMHEALTSLGAIAEREVDAEPGWRGWLGALAADRRATQVRWNDGARGAWVAAERLPLLVALHPDATLAPPIAATAGGAQDGADRADALRELVRARLAGLGPTTVAALADAVDVAVGDVDAALAALQQEGTVLQGRFGPEAMAGGAIEWCERHLLARIHRYTLGRLRREIEPVEPRDFARFVFEWQHVAPGARVSGPDALAGVLAQLEGFEAPAASWETELLPARVGDYAPRWLDELCTSGRTLWMRLRPTAADARGGVLRATPILLLPRRSAGVWSGLPPAPSGEERIGSRARRVADFLAEHGASFFDDIAAEVRLLPAELEDALAELVVHGIVHGDSFAGLRALLVPPSRRAAKAARGRAWSGVPDAGRWSLARRRAAPPAEMSSRAAALDAPALEHVVRTLLRRYGVVCWRLLEREPAWLPPWRDLVRVLRRLEARGELRGGRFIAGVAGEQYALPDAVAMLRQVRRRPGDGTLVCVAATDPANLLGSIVAGQRVARVPGARVLWRDGVPLATSVAGQVEWLAADVDPAERARLARAIAVEPFAQLEARLHGERATV